MMQINLLFVKVAENSKGSRDALNSGTPNSNMRMEKKYSKELIGRTVISKQGKKYGVLGDIVFETRSGELIHMVLDNPTSYSEKLELEKDKSGKRLIPFSAVIALGDFVVVAEEDIV